MTFLSATEINNRIKRGDNYTLIDIREPYEVEVCSINSRNIPMASLIDYIDELKSVKNIVLICRSGKRAESVANWLESDYNIPNIIVIEGGIIQWKEQVDRSLKIDD
ncbi:MAG: rhodanese-like domain-containing protein [Bacteroidota bacterium]